MKLLEVLKAENPRPAAALSFDLLFASVLTCLRLSEVQTVLE